MLMTVAIGIVFLLLRLPSLFEPYWYGDEGIYLTLGQAINHGLTLFSQIHDNKPPTLYYLAAIWPTVFGFRLLLLLWMIPTVYFFYRLASNFLSSKSSKIATLVFVVISSIPLIEGNIANAEIFMLLPTILAVYLFLFSHSKLKILYSGLLLGFAFTIKVPVFFEFAIIGFWILFSSAKIISKLKQILIISLGFVTPILIWSIYFVIRQAFPQFIFSALLQNFGYLSSWSTGSHSGSATSGGMIFRLFLLLIALATLLFLKYKKFISLNSFYLASWLSACLFGVLLSTRPYPHYLIQIVPPLVIVLFQLKKIVYWPILFTLIFSLFHYRFYFYPVFSYYQNFYFQGNRPQYFNSGIDQIYQISQYLKKNTTATDRIFVWGDQPFIYPLADRLPATKYVVAYHIVDFNQYDFTYNELSIRFPQVIVYYPQPNRPFPKLDNFIKKYYYLDNSIGEALLFRYRQ